MVFFAISGLSVLNDSNVDDFGNGYLLNMSVRYERIVAEMIAPLEDQ